MITCSFCSNEFELTEGLSSCNGCLMSKNCKKVKCPKCNFENAVSLSDFKKLKELSKLPTNLAELKSGSSAEIINISNLKIEDINKLCVFGIFPGETVQVLQTFPSIVVRIGNTSVALDKKTAKNIAISKI